MPEDGPVLPNKEFEEEWGRERSVAIAMEWPCKINLRKYF